MRELIEKKFHSAKVFRIILLLLLLLSIGTFVAMGFAEHMEPLIGPAMLFLNAFWISGVVYYAKFYPILSSVKWLAQIGLPNVADDIILEQPTLPQSKIFCGYYALFSKKTCVIIPYGQIAWAHLYERRTYGITVEKAVILYTKDGKKFSLNADVDEFKWLLENYIIPQSPNIILGYGAEQKKRFKQCTPEAVKASKKVKRIWGIVLMILGLGLLIAALVNQATVDPGLLIILSIFGAGAALFVAGNKK